jgi:hypothetical protein
MADSITGTSSSIDEQVQSFSRQTTDKEYESLAASRFIGYLRKDQTRLNVFSALSANDLQDNFHFRVMEGGKVAFGYSVNGEDPDIRVQLINRNSGRVLADSALKEDTPAGKAWNDLRAGDLELQAAEYVIRVQRPVGVSRTETSAYALQLTMGTTYEGDYDTTETPAQRSYTQIQQPASVIASILDTSTPINTGILSLLV